MFKRELKINLKNLLIWIFIGVFLFSVVYIIYPSIMENSNKEMINQLMNTMPEDLLKIFNMDLADIDTAFGWFKTEGYVYLVLVASLYASILASNILTKEESDKTIEFLYSKPIKKSSIVTPKILVGMINTITMLIVFLLVNIIGMSMVGHYNLEMLIKLSLIPLLTIIPLYLLCLYISIYFNNTKKTIGICMGITFISYFLLIIANLSDKVKVFKYFSLFTLSDSRKLITTNNIEISSIIISVIISIVLMMLIYQKYQKKELGL